MTPRMGSIFASTDSNVIIHQENITLVLRRRGKNDVVWYQDTNGYLYTNAQPCISEKESIKQPLIDKDGIFLFTGELWDVPPSEPDALVFVERIRTSGLSRTIKSARGNWAFVYWDTKINIFRLQQMKLVNDPYITLI